MASIEETFNFIKKECFSFVSSAKSLEDFAVEDLENYKQFLIDSFKEINVDKTYESPEKDIVAFAYGIIDKMLDEKSNIKQ